ncbi:unnamed protein product [Spirodela intermedia]|uniref:Uncharacterized protein n=1 Tax=Spirodela intermedia TaxID=51605 RepID=A0ABN7EBR9_SPIIN|nr:unnamed protein product [Spirodela intermedia]
MFYFSYLIETIIHSKLYFFTDFLLNLIFLDF